MSLNLEDWIKMKTDNLIKDEKHYNKFIGDYGLLWNNGFEDYTIVSRLFRVKSQSCGTFVFATDIGAGYDNFQPLTKEQLECLNLKN